MSETSPKKPKVGGPRPGSGRPPGVKNKATKAREARLRRELKAALADMTDEVAQELSADPFTAMTRILQIYLKSGDLTGAAAIAKELLPFTRPKLSSAEALQPMPADLMGDPPAEPDEPLPEGMTIIDPGAKTARCLTVSRAELT